MNAFVLKIIACITMFMDHISYAIPEKTYWLNYIGRLSFPIFAFQVSEGYTHTKNLKKYIFRLLLFASISQIPYMLFYNLITPNTLVLNVIFTLLLGLISITIYDKYNKYVGFISAIYFGIIAQVSHCDYGFYGVAIIFLFYVFRNNKILLTVGFEITSIIYYGYHILKYYSKGTAIVTKAFQLYWPFAVSTMLAIVPILLYNKKKGPNTKHLLYLFYPLHLLLIYALSFVI